jgi:hypothetical protein
LASELVRGLHAYEAEYSDYKKGVAPHSNEPVVDCPGDLKARMSQLLGCVARVKPYLTHSYSQRALGAAGGSGDEAALRSVAVVVSEAYVSLLQWKGSVLGAEVPAEWKPLYSATAECADLSIARIREFAYDWSVGAQEFAASLRSGKRPRPLSVTLTFDIGNEPVAKQHAAITVLKESIRATSPSIRVNQRALAGVTKVVVSARANLSAAEAQGGPESERFVHPGAPISQTSETKGLGGAKDLGALPQRPPPADHELGWGVLYFTSELSRGIKLHEHEYFDYLNGMVRDTDENVTDILAYSKAKLAECKVLIEELSAAFNSHLVDKAFGHNRLTGDAAAGAFVADSIVNVYAALIDFALRVRGTTMPPEWKAAAWALGEYVRRPIQQVREYSENANRVAIQYFAALRSGQQPNEGLHLTLKLEMGTDASSALMDALNRAMAGMQRPNI